MTDKCREEFEKFVAQRYSGDTLKDLLTRFSKCGGYVEAHINSEWKGWKAAWDLLESRPRYKRSCGTAYSFYCSVCEDVRAMEPATGDGKGGFMCAVHTLKPKETK